MGGGWTEAAIERELASNEESNAEAAERKPALEQDALYGLPGDIVRAIDPYTEADPIAILTNTLAAFGNVVGPRPYARVENTRHHLNLFVVQVGATSKGRKGTGWSTPKRMFTDVDRQWSDEQVTGGLSSGEGLIYAVRDQRSEDVPVKEKGRVVDYQSVVVDEGAPDKRLLLIEQELSQVLKVMAREGNTLSAILRQAWDGGNLTPLTKNNRTRATGAHVSIIGHITREELLRHLTETEQSNGFANRFCWFLVSRSKIIPDPTGTPEDKLSPLTERLRDAVEFAREVDEVRRDAAAAAIWEAVYPELSEGKPAMSGAVMSRGEAQVMRLSCIYALLDQSKVVTRDHLRAALGLWDYSEKSALAIFGGMTGDPALDKVKEALRAEGTLTMTQVYALFANNIAKAEVDRVIASLLKEKLATVETDQTGNGRPSKVLRWRGE